jgi:hypothetical protein
MLKAAAHEADAGGMAGRRYGAWITIRADATGRRILCACACGTVREVGLEALQSGQSQGCGCSRTFTAPKPPAANRAPGFAADLAALEGQASSKWHHGGGRSS